MRWPGGWPIGWCRGTSCTPRRSGWQHAWRSDRRGRLRDRILEQMERESRIFSAQLRSAEAKEAFQAFAEKRQPDFSRL